MGREALRAGISVEVTGTEISGRWDSDWEDLDDGSLVEIEAWFSGTK